MNKFITVILVTLFATCQSDEEVGELKCPLHWVDGTEYGLGCIYFHHLESMPWIKARYFCKSQNSSYLVEIFSQEQQDFIVQEIIENEFISGVERYWWIGLTDILEEGRFLWAHSLKEPTYTSWYSGDPDGEENQNAVAIEKRYDYMWTDANEDAKLYPICQFHPDGMSI